MGDRLISSLDVPTAKAAGASEGEAEMESGSGWIPRRGTLAAILAAGVLVPRCPAFSPPLEISAPSSSERSTPRVTVGTSGNLYVVYVNKATPWQVYFREMTRQGQWGPVEPISSGFATRPDVVEDDQGRPHIVFASVGSGGSLDLVHAYRSGEWNSSLIAATAQYEDQPHVAADSAGRIHLVFTRGSIESSSADVIYRVWNGLTWGDETVIGHVYQAYYDRPSLCIDSADQVHVTWIDKTGSEWKVRYRKWNGASGRTSPTWARAGTPALSSTMPTWRPSARATSLSSGTTMLRAAARISYTTTAATAGQVGPSACRAAGKARCCTRGTIRAWMESVRRPT